MINREFTDRINALRRELIDAIIMELRNDGITMFVFPDDIDKSEIPWQTVTDKNGETSRGWVTAIEIYSDNHLAIHSEDYFNTYTTYTTKDWEANEIDFLVDLYECLQYYLNETK